MDVKEAREKVLKNIEVEVKPIERFRPYHKEGHDGAFMFTGCKKTYMLPYYNNTSSYAKIFEDPEDQEAFEVLLNKQSGSLNIYGRNSEFWGVEYKVTIDKKGKVLDLSIPSHALEYLVLKANKTRISPDWKSRKVPTYEFALVNKAEEDKKDFAANDKFMNAMADFLKVKKSTSKMYNMLRVMGKSMTKESATNSEWLAGELLKIINQKEKPKGKKDLWIDDYIEVSKDKKFETKVLIYDAISIGEIITKGGYYQHDGETIGKSLTDAANWFESVKNQEKVLFIKQRLENNK